MKHNDFAVGMIREQLLGMVSCTRLRVGERNTVFEAAEIIGQLKRERDEAREALSALSPLRLPSAATSPEGRGEEILVRLNDDSEAGQVWKTEICFDSEEERDGFERKLAEGWCPLEWIKEEDELPAREGEMVLCVVNDRCGGITFRNAIQLGYYAAAEGWVLEAFPEFESPNVTHWMELPEGPGEEK